MNLRMAPDGVAETTAVGDIAGAMLSCLSFCERFLATQSFDSTAAFAVSTIAPFARVDSTQPAELHLAREHARSARWAMLLRDMGTVNLRPQLARRNDAAIPFAQSSIR
jgi:hypothetical protein